MQQELGYFGSLVPKNFTTETQKKAKQQQVTAVVAIIHRVGQKRGE